MDKRIYENKALKHEPVDKSSRRNRKAKDKSHRPNVS